ncbi:TPA: 50S ribosomal protein L21 [Candidatus Bipolaricaulota bacterium]|nr:50S ribosomal protein L21 [Candidatus Bipolaricaulota bacterium]
MYAVIEIGGKQYRVQPGESVVHELVPGHEPGDPITFDHVLLVKNGEGVVVGRPYVESAKVIGEVVEIGRLPKVIVQRFKPKKGYRRKKGHRQPYMKTVIQAIEKG